MATVSSPPVTLRVPPYARISDTDEERAPGIDRQLRTVLPLIGGRGAVATREYIDNNKSAFQPDVYRKDFEQWLQDFIENKNDGVAAYDFDRLFRQPLDLERVIEAYRVASKQSRPHPVLWLPSMTLDLTNKDGKLVARTLVNASNNSSDATAKRITDFYRDEALKGNIYSNHPAFYRNPDGSINAGRAAITLRAIDDVLNKGLRPTAIADEWRKQHITTAHGGAVNGATVHRILTSPGIAGLAVYKREILLDDDGNYIKRNDGGLIDEPTWHKLCSKLETKPGSRQRPTKALLSHILRCGLCGAGMVRIQRKRKSGGIWFHYNCRSNDSGGCAGVGISGPKLDQQITELVLDYLRQPLEVDDKPFAGEERLTEITANIAELMSAYRKPASDPGHLSGSLVFPNIKQLQDEQKQLRRQAAKHERSQQRITTAADEWPVIGLDRQKAIISMIFEAIVIEPATKRRGGMYEPTRVRPVYREISHEQLLSELSAMFAAGGRSKSGLVA